MGDHSPLTLGGLRRGSAYVVVLGAAMIVTVLGFSAVQATRVERRASAGDEAAVKARFYAESAIDVVRYRLDNNASWRSTAVNDAWTSAEIVGEAELRYKLVDEGDANLANDPMDPVRLTAKATVGNVVRIYGIYLESEEPQNLLTNADMEDGLTGWTGIGPEGSCDLTSDASVPHGGSACLLATNRMPDNYTGPHQDITSLIVHGQPYYAEVWFKDTLASGTKYVVCVLDTSAGIQLVWFSQSWSGTSWQKLSGTFTPTWSGTLNAAYFRTGTGSGTSDYRIDDALLVEGTGPPSYPLTPVTGSWRREVQ